jgi:hypothetical protein
MRKSLLLSLVWLACHAGGTDAYATVPSHKSRTYYKDADGDGFGNASQSKTEKNRPKGYVPNRYDCNDNDRSIHPFAKEVKDGKDNDCDGMTDENYYFRDEDGDGFGGWKIKQATSRPGGYVDKPNDCNDSDKSTYPGAPEIKDGKDNNCNGKKDEGLTDGTAYYKDHDGDGFGDPDKPRKPKPEKGYVANNSDCNDNDKSVNPSATEVKDGKDNDCDGLKDENIYYRDADGDGLGGQETKEATTKPSGYVETPGDCNDNDKTIYANAPELCDGKDNDCDGETDEGVKKTFFVDADGDGFGSTDATKEECSAPAGYVENSDDNDDKDKTIYPGAPEVCDGKDNDQNGTVDDGGNMTTYYADKDSDGFGNSADSKVACTKPDGYVTNDDDANDNDNTVYPGATEVCDGKDNDQDGAADEFIGTTWYRDLDEDGYGDPNNTIKACSPPEGIAYSSNDDDCNDADNTVHPGAPEVCDGKDNDCDGQVDDGAGTAYYRDADDDGFGDPNNSVRSCSPPPGYVTSKIDCDDTDAGTYDSAAEICDGKDNDCDGQVDEDNTYGRTWYRDADGDGWGTSTDIVKSCSQPIGYVNKTGDCNDADRSVNPTAREECDGKDNDCDGVVDEDTDYSTVWYRDADGDAFGDINSSITTCNPPPGYTRNSGDCDDTRPGDFMVIYYEDTDGDGYGMGGHLARCPGTEPRGWVQKTGDCNNNDNTVYPGAPEFCDGKDNDCDGQVDEGVKTTWYQDADGDGYGNSSVNQQSCTQPTGYVNRAGDCNDGNNTIHPGAREVCDGIDQNCNGGFPDDGLLFTFKYRDADGDGYGDPNQPFSACNVPPGYVDNDDDCNDNDPTVNPGSTDPSKNCSAPRARVNAAGSYQAELSASTLFPNPAHDELTINLSRPASELKSVKVSTVIDQTMIQGDYDVVEGDKIRLRVRHLSQGVHIIRLDFGDGFEVLKFIKN